MKQGTGEQKKKTKKPEIPLLSSHLVGGSAAVIWREKGCSYGDCILH